MVDRDLEAKSQLVARAREKAEKRGTTLEEEVQNWLARYVDEPDDFIGHSPVTKSSPLWSSPKTKITRAVDSLGKPRPATRTKAAKSASGDTRSEAYKRLLDVMSDSSKRPS